MANIDPRTGLPVDDPDAVALLDSPRPTIPLPAAAGDAPSGLPPAGVAIPQVAPAPPAPAAPAAGVALPAAPLPGLPPQEKQTTATDTSTTTTRKLVSADEKKNQQQIGATEAEQEKALRAQGDLTGQAADIQAVAAAKKAEIQKQYGDQAKAVAAAGTAEVARRIQAYDDAQQRYTEAKPSNFFDRPDGSGRDSKRTFWAGVAMALGGYASAQNGGHNIAAEMIDKAIDRHAREEAERIDRLGKTASSKRGDIELARQKQSDALTNLQAWRASAYDQAASELESRLAALGRPAAEIKANQDVLALRQKAQEVKQQWFDQTRTEVHTTVAKKVSDILGTGGPGGAGAQGRGLVDARQRAQTVQALDQALKTAAELQGKGVRLSEADLQRIQDNDLALKTAQEGHGPGSAIMTKLGRTAGVIPRNRYEGLSPEKQALAGALDTVTQKSALFAAGSHTQEEMAHARGLVNVLEPGLSTDERQRRLNYARDLLGTNRALIGDVGKLGAAGAAAELAQSGGSPSPAAPGRAELKSTADGLAQWIRANPKDPRLGAAKAKLKEYMDAMREAR